MRLTLPKRPLTKYLKLVSSVVVLASLIYVGAGLIRVDAATAAIVPDSAVSSTWTGSYTAIDEGTTTTSDYINSGSTSGVSGQFGMSDLGNLSSASSISVNVCAYSATNANGGTLDDLTVNVLINGVAQTAQTITPAYSGTSTCTLYNPIVLNGTYTLSDINSLQLTLATTVKGSGNPTGQIDDIRVANAYMSITYTQATTIAQANYRWFANADSATPGSPLAAQDTAAAVPAGTVARLRQRIAVDGGALSQSANNYKLQYSPKVGTCDVGFSGETYTDVNGPGGTAASTPTTAVNDSSYGTTAWTNPTGAVTSGDSSFAETISPSVVGATDSQYLKLSNFGFSIPANATITGVKATFYVGSNAMSGVTGRTSMKIVKAGAATGTDKGTVWYDSSTTTDIAGSSSDLWGTTLTPADVNASNFGVAIAASATYNDFASFQEYVDVDGVTLDVYYTAPPSPLEYFDNATPADVTTITSSGNDPVNGARPTVYQSYHELNPFTNNVGSIAAGSDGIWDFSLKLASNATGSYCIRVVKADGSLLNSYDSVSEVAVQPASLTQANYRWLANADSVTPGSALAPQDTSATVTPGTNVRLRQRVAVDSGSESAGARSFKLQYAEKVGICDPTFTGESYVDVPTATQAGSQSNSTLTRTATASSGFFSVNDAIGSDDVYASDTVAPTAIVVDTLYVYNSDWNIPSNATITGYRIGYEGSWSSLGTISNKVSVGLYNNGDGTHGDSAFGSASASEALRYVGGSTDTFGTSYTPADINNSTGFGAYVKLYKKATSATSVNVLVDDLFLEIYYTVPSAGGNLDFHTNASVTNGATISSVVDDPTNGGRAATYQTYQDSNPFTTSNTVAAGDDALWDFSLQTGAGADGKNYCFRVVHDDGSPLDTYSQIPELAISSGGGGPTLDQQMRGGQYVIGGTKGKFTW